MMHGEDSSQNMIHQPGKATKDALTGECKGQKMNCLWKTEQKLNWFGKIETDVIKLEQEQNLNYLNWTT